MMSWINRLLQKRLNNQEQNLPPFLALGEYENEFSDYYQMQLESTFKNYLLQKATNLNRYINLLAKSILISIISLIITLLIIFTPLNHYYNKIAIGFDRLTSSYTTWWYGLPKWIQIISPSKLIVWSFPRPLTLELIFLIGIGLYLLIFLIRMRVKLKEQILLPIYQYMGEFYHSNETTIQNEEFYNALMLPPYDNIIFNQGSIRADYSDVAIEIAEAILSKADPDSKFKPFTPVFIGIFIVVHFKNECPIKGHHIFMSSTYSWLDKLFAQDKKFNKYGYSGKSELYSSNIDEIIKIDANGLLATLAEVEKIILQNNRDLALSHFDDKLTNLFKRIKSLRPLEGVDKLIQCAIYEEKLFIMLPTNRELLSTQSIFDLDLNRYHQDIHVILAAVYLAFLFINHINSTANHE